MKTMILVLLSLVLTGCTQEPPAKAVSACVTEVRAKHERYDLKYGYGQFEAYVSKGVVHTNGSAKETFSFNKCLAKAEWTIWGDIRRLLLL